MSVVIQVENLSKYYRLGLIGGGTLREDLQRWWAMSRGRPDPLLKIGQKDHGNRKGGEIWALRDVSFEVHEGQILGIIGRNGAGKSTLLKILSRITAPTGGQIKIKGRVGSLLEVGTGFHPELTGRENIYLNGAILGMKKTEITGKLDEIIDFAEIAQFIDTPVKRYSSGMYVRLAFAVAAHLEPEILVVDEVLAVGDTVFQRKCVDKMLSISRKGCTVLFVSHNMQSVKTLCDTAILLNAGSVFFRGEVDEVVESYLSGERLTGSEIDLSGLERAHQCEQAIVFDRLTLTQHPIPFGSDLVFHIKLKTKKPDLKKHQLDFGIAVLDKNANTIIHCSNRYLNVECLHESDDNVYVFSIENRLKPGRYTLTLFLRDRHAIQDWLTDQVAISIEDGNPYDFPDTKQIQGVILPEFHVRVVRQAE